MRTLALLLMFAPGVAAQFDASAPEPIHPLGGTLFVGGGGAVPDEAFDRFIEMSGGAESKIAVLSVGAADDDLLASLRARKPKQVESIVGVRGDAERVVTALAEATAAWLCADSGAQFAAAFRGGPVEQALRSLIGRAGVVGCNGDISNALTRAMITGGTPQATLEQGLDLIPGATIDVGYTQRNRRNPLLGVLASQPTLVGLGIDEGTCMVLQRRFIDVLGPGSVYACVAASEHRPLRVERVDRTRSPRTQRRALAANAQARGNRRRPRNPERAWRPRRLEDLIALSRSASARARPRFPADEPPVPHVENGTLMIVGGGGSPKGFTERFIELAGGPDAPLVYVPCTESEAVDREPRMLTSWRRAGAKDVRWIHTKDRHAADTDEEIHAKLRDARGIFFGGGRQWNLVDSYQHTRVHELFEAVLARGGVIAGSSAGASIQASYMVRGNSLGNIDPMAEGYDTGLGFLTGVAIDQHFSQRGRLADMTSLVDTYPQLLGIGIDEAACLIVHGSIAEVWAREGRNVLFYDRRRPVVPGEPDCVKVANGQRFDLAARQILPAADKKR